jgi:glycosyltransferase involved in cell wall biosynthesis
MNLLIDASNIRAGGGKTHLIELLRNSTPQDYGFDKIIVCATKLVLSQIDDRTWLQKISHPLLEGSWVSAWYWRLFQLEKLVKKNNAFLFCPGANQPMFDWPYVTMCQNLLPLEIGEIFRYGFSSVAARLFLLRYFHIRAYQNACGVIFLTQYCHSVFTVRLNKKVNNCAVVPHGLNSAIFGLASRSTARNSKQSFSVLYVSIIDVYKNQDKVVEAVIQLNKEGHDTTLTLLGPAYPPSMRRINKILSANSLQANKIVIKDAVPYNQMAQEYLGHDMFIFASSCETFGMILTESMAMGCPIACSNRSSMSETLGNAGIYFDPMDIEDIKKSIVKLKMDEALRKELSLAAIARSSQFTWPKCSHSTFSFISEIAKKSNFQ